MPLLPPRGMSRFAVSSLKTTGKKDLIAGLVLIVLGMATITEAATLEIGSLTHVGPGFFPCVLGGILVLLGVLILLTQHRAAHPDEHDANAETTPDWRGWASIIGGVLLFIVLGTYFGLGPATFACVFVSALGDRASGPVTALTLALACTAFAAIVFCGLLQFQMPFIRW